MTANPHDSGANGVNPPDPPTPLDPPEHPGNPRAEKHPGTVPEVFGAFLLLGLTSFGGPVAHLGFFRTVFVEKRRWLTDSAYADLVALCHFLPGPSSSQVGMGIGLQRAGLPGLIAAWVAFTLPSALLLVLFAIGMAAVDGGGGAGWLFGVKAGVVAIVAHAVLGMARSLITGAATATIAAASMITMILVPHTLAQVSVIAVAAMVGLVFLRSKRAEPGVASATVKPTNDTAEDTAGEPFSVRVSRGVAVASLALFGALLALLPILAATGNATARLVDIFYRSGALVFGGGHVVLPLLEAETVQTGLVNGDAFLAGYGAAQAVPGPLFTFAAYLGTVAETSPNGVLGAAIALVAIFVPAALLVIGVLPFWDQLRRSAHTRSALAGVNAAVVGLLAAALYTPVFTEGVTSPLTMAVAVLAFIALSTWKTPAWAIIIASALLGFALL